MGLSQQALAERVGVSRQAVLSIEAGRQVPSTALALQLAHTVGRSVEDLFACPSCGAYVRAGGTCSCGRKV
jgi:putative transcriptional regulator